MPAEVERSWFEIVCTYMYTPVSHTHIKRLDRSNSRYWLQA